MQRVDAVSDKMIQRSECLILLYIWKFKNVVLLKSVFSDEKGKLFISIHLDVNQQKSPELITSSY